jgi:hypothetical protein
MAPDGLLNLIRAAGPRSQTVAVDISDVEPLVVGHFQIDRIADGQYRLRQAPKDRILHLILVGNAALIAIFFIVLIARNAQGWAKWFFEALMILLVIAAGVFVEARVDEKQRLITVRYRLLGRIDVGRRRWQALDHDSVAIFLESSGEDWYRYVFVTRNRTRFRVIGRRRFAREPEADLQEVAQLVARLLRIEYRAYAQKGEFYWW